MQTTIAANNPNLKSWLPVNKNSDFPIQNLPFGIFSSKDNKQPRCATIIGDHVIDLAALSHLGYFSKLPVNEAMFEQSILNNFIKTGKHTWRSVRNHLSSLFNADNEQSNNSINTLDKERILYKTSEVQMHLPVQVGDYTDFYSSKEHATNVGSMFRDPNNALLPNWLHLPVGYHGRASSIVVSGTPIRRPMGQTRPNAEQPPVFGPARLLDFELEMGVITGQGKPLGQRINPNEADDYIFGLVLFNDWSARDIQKWEYVPLGPFLGKNFASSISPWIVTLDALSPFYTKAAQQEPAVLPYLQQTNRHVLDVNLSVGIRPEQAEETTVCQSNFKYMYWTMQQQLAHHTVNGCNINAGDILASGTISGPVPSSYGSMLELSWRGTKPVSLKDGSTRKFINDGDTVIMRGYAQNEQVRIGFGEVSGKILSAMA